MDGEILHIYMLVAMLYPLQELKIGFTSGMQQMCLAKVINRTHYCCVAEQVTHACLTSV